MPARLKLLLAVLLVRDPDMTFEVKRNWTLVNTLAWAVIVLPMFAVNQWLKVKTRKD
jgi:hypothetical protein